MLHIRALGVIVFVGISVFEFPVVVIGYVIVLIFVIFYLFYLLIGGIAVGMSIIVDAICLICFIQFIEIVKNTVLVGALGNILIFRIIEIFVNGTERVTASVRISFSGDGIFTCFVGCNFVFVILSSGGTFFFWHMSFDKVSFLDVFRGAFGADDVAASREDCLFMVFGGIMCSSFYISVI